MMKMKPLQAWSVVNRKTGLALNNMTYTSRKLAELVRGESVESYRVARVRIGEVTK